MFMNVFHKTFALAFSDSLLKIRLNCDKENHVDFKYMQFLKLFSNLTCSDLLIDKICS